MEYSDDEIKAVFADRPRSWHDALFKLKQNGSRNNYITLKRRVMQIGITPKFFKRPYLPKATTETAFIKDSPYGTKTIRKLYENLFPVKECCGSNGEECIHKKTNYIWTGGNLVDFHLHHIDGDTKNNVLSNLTWICITCHSQTSNFGGKASR